jgi:hypothetical protein
MDHLQGLEDVAYNPPKIPLLCGPDLYSNPLPFSAYPHHMGWVIDVGNIIPSITKPVLSRQADSTTYLTQNTPSDMLAFLQSWLFFGVVNEVFEIMGVSIDATHFVTTDSTGQSIITTECLRGYIDKWSRLPRDAEASVEHCHCLMAVFDIFRVVDKCSDILFNYVLAQPHMPDREREAVPLVALGVGILNETLRNAYIFIEYDHPEAKADFPSILLSCSKEMIAHQMKNLGWCPNQIASLASLTDAAGFYLASLVNRPYLLKEDHGNCTETICLGNQIDDKTYKTRHIKDGCTCQHIGVNMAKVEAILKDHCIPRVTLLQNGHSAMTLDVVDSGPYVAVSHVWSHGLGNPRNNSLPRCQLQRLTHYINGLGVPNLCLWIDTLCIPVSDRDLRTKAILQLPQIFRGAHTALVLDAELYDIPQHGVSGMEIATRIFCCGWMRRLWTFQEAFVSNSSESPLRRDKLLIQFGDGTIGMTALLKCFETSKSLYYTNTTVKSTVKRMPRNMAWLQSETKNRVGDVIRPVDLLMTLASPFEYRTTSRAGDEAISLAIMLDLDLPAILCHTGAEERMKQLFITLGEVPRGIIWSDGGKVSLKGARWAPSSLLSAKDPAARFSTRITKAMVTAVSQSSYASPTDDGLLTICPGLLLRSDSKDAQELWFHPPAFMNEQGWISTIQPDPWEPMPAGSKRRDEIYELIRTLNRPAILLRPLTSGDRFWNVAALVSIDTDDNGVLHASFQCKIQLIKGTEQMAQDARSWLTGNFGDTDDFLRSLGIDTTLLKQTDRRFEVQVEPTSLEQKWCIS